MLPKTQIALIKELDGQIANLQKQNDDLTQALEDLQQQYNQQLEENAEINDQNIQYKFELQESTELLKQAGKQVEQHIGTINELKIENQTLKDELNNRREAQLESERALSQAVLHLNQNKQMIDITNDKYNNQILMHKLHFLTEENGAQKMLIQDYEKTIESLKTQVRDAEMMKIELETNYEMLCQKLKHQEETIANQQLQIQQCINDQNQSISTLGSIQLSDIVVENQKEEVDKYKYKIEVLEQQIQSTQDRNKQLMQDRDESKMKQHKLTVELQTEQQKLKELQSQYDLLQKQYNTEKKMLQDQIDYLVSFNKQQQPQNVTELIGQYKEFVMQQQQQNHQYNIENFQQRQQQTQQILGNNLTSPAEEFYKNQTEQQKSIIQQLQNDIKDKSKQILDLNNQVSKLQMQIYTKDQQITQLENQNSDLLDKEKSADQKINDTKHKYISLLNQQKRDHDQIISKYQTIIKKLQNNGAVDKYQQRDAEEKKRLYNDIQKLIEKIDNKQATNSQNEQDEKIQKYEQVLKKGLQK